MTEIVSFSYDFHMKRMITKHEDLVLFKERKQLSKLIA